MSKERLLAYTDAVLAIIITIMVLEFKIPHSSDWSALFELRSVFLAYALSFAYLTIYRNNHHHMFQVISKISSPILRANSILLFCLSCIPFVTGWMSENHFAQNTVILYGFVLFCCAAAYSIIVRALQYSEGYHSKFSKAINKDQKGKLSLFLYALGVILTVTVSPSR